MDLHRRAMRGSAGKDSAKLLRHIEKVLSHVVVKEFVQLHDSVTVCQEPSFQISRERL